MKLVINASPDDILSFELTDFPVASNGEGQRQTPASINIGSKNTENIKDMIRLLALEDMTAKKQDVLKNKITEVAKKLRKIHKHINAIKGEFDDVSFNWNLKL